MNPTFEIVLVDGAPAIRCLLCGSLSVLAGDVANKYCVRCHLFHDAVADGRRLVIDGGSHDCAEWRTARGFCALCGHAVGVDVAAAAAMAVEIASKPPLELVCHPMTVFQLTALVQLALRHPSVPPDIRTTAERFVVGAREYFADCPAVLAVVRRGDEPAEDVPPQVSWP
jgi:hypothetical protein